MVESALTVLCTIAIDQIQTERKISTYLYMYQFFSYFDYLDFFVIDCWRTI